MCIPFWLFLKIWKVEWEIEAETEEFLCPFVVHFPNVVMVVLGYTEAQSQELQWVSWSPPWVAGDQILEPFSTAFPDKLADCWIRKEQPGLRNQQFWYGILSWKWWFNFCATGPDLTYLSMLKTCCGMLPSFASDLFVWVIETHTEKDLHQLLDSSSNCSGFPDVWQELKHLNPSLLLSPAIIRELDYNWCSQNINWYPYGMPALKAIALVAMP